MATSVRVNNRDATFRRAGDHELVLTPPGRRDWAAEHRYGNGTTEQFEALATRVSGQDLATLFQTWPFTPGRPGLPTAPANATASRGGAVNTPAQALPGPAAAAPTTPVAPVAPVAPRSWALIQQARAELHGH